MLSSQKAVGSICSLFLCNSDLKVMEGAGKWAQRESHELHVDDTYKNYSSFKVNNFLLCSNAGLYLHKLMSSSWRCKQRTLGASASHCMTAPLAWRCVINGQVQSILLSKVGGLDQMSALPVFHIDTLLDKTEDAPELWSLVKDVCQAADNTGRHLCHLVWTLG